MKVSKISIKDFHQFKDLELDLTYPAGHPKAGEPLDQVCFIGQSGTGKTTLLEMIPKFLFDYDTNSFSDDVENYYGKLTLALLFGHKNECEFHIEFVSKEEGDDSDWKWQLPAKLKSAKDGLTDEERSILWDSWADYFDKEWYGFAASKLVYFPANLNFEIDPSEGIGFDTDDIIDFSIQNVSAVWNLLLETIQKYQEQELQIRQEISKTVEESFSDLETIKAALTKLEAWKKNEFNPIADVAENCLDPLLAHFKVRVKRELDIKKKEDLGFIKIEDFNKNEIPHSVWSTGTKQVILSALPLYLLKPKNTIILFDEPERSLYPDLQRQIVKYYQSLTENCQFFYSTHSPIIASNFEPWEIVELKFNDSGEIYRELYYQDENHVDNYFVDPRYLDYDLILKKIFDLKDTSTDMRMEALVELSMLKNQLDQLKQEGKLQTSKAKDILTRYKLLAKKLAWKTE